MLSSKQALTSGTCFIMAAPAAKMVGVSDDSSSSDDEALKRCREAVWESRAEKKKGDSFSVVFANEAHISVQTHKHQDKRDVSLLRSPPLISLIFLINIQTLAAVT